MARGIPFSESVAFSAAGAGTTDAVLVSNPDTDAYPSVYHVDTTLGTNITSFKLGWKKGTDFEAFLDSRLDTQLIGVFQMPLSTTYVGASITARIVTSGASAGTQIILDGEFKR